MESGQDADAVKKSFNRIMKSPNSVEDAKKLIGYIGDNEDAMNGARRTFVESMLDSPNPHEFINQNRQVLNMFLDNPIQQKMLDKIARTSEVISNTAKTPSGKNKVAAKLLDPENYLTALVGVKKAAAIYGAAGLAGLTSGAIAYKLGLPIAESGILEATGIAGAVKSPQIVRYMYNAQKEKVVNTITDAFLHPDQGRMLLENMNDVNNKKYVPRIMSGIVDSNLFAKGAAIAAVVSKYASGGPVYTHPAISSIRAKRAMRSFAR